MKSNAVIMVGLAGFLALPLVARAQPPAPAAASAQAPSVADAVRQM